MLGESDRPEKPQLRPVEVSRVTHEGNDYFLLKDIQRISDQSLLVPVPLGLYLQGFDGTRTINESVEYALANGAPTVPTEILDDLVGRLDDLHLLANGKFADKVERQLEDYRNATHRTPALAGLAYPAETAELRGYLDGFAFPYMTYGEWAADELPADLDARLTGIISPHIDFERGGDTYGMIWEQVLPMIRDVELFVVFGTDHNGGGPRLTLTNQNYYTPLGTIETDTELVDDVARILSTDPTVEDHPFADEFNHINEHSIELATVWLQRAAVNTGAKMLPILCGSFGKLLTDGTPSVNDHPEIGRVIRLLQSVARQRRTVFVAAADLAHVGPAFGDEEEIPPDSGSRKRVEADDERLMDAIMQGSHHRFFDEIKKNGDANRICGLAPIYMTLWAADATIGTWMGYKQCQADSDDTSFVSIAGAALFSEK